ncbi:MAG: hypothetical protein HY807_08120 [Nitrospirae bacterium]|nr:hypothetical protein [Nitrospirota bacterium]
MKLELLPRIEPDKAVIVLSTKRGIYFWFSKDTDNLIYIGIALGAGGLKKRIVSQHLNPAYLEFRPEKHTEKDRFQLEHAIHRISKDEKNVRYGIDKSAFRKSIGRKLKLKPGIETVTYIMKNLYLKVFESENISIVRALEIDLIKKYEPVFNTSHNTK